MWNGSIHDCQQCGACCSKPGFVEGPSYAYLTRDEAKRMKRLRLSVLNEDGTSYLGTRAGPDGKGPDVCVAFQGEVGGDCGCSVYSDRPRVCREFQVGSPGCLGARKRLGLPS